MKTQRSDIVLGAIMDRDRERRHRRRSQLFRFNLATLCGLVLLSSLAFAGFRYWGPEIIERVQFRWAQSTATLPDTSVSEVLPPVSICVAALIGMVICGLVYKLDPRKSFFLLGGIVFASFFTFVLLLGWEVEPFASTPLQKVSAAQMIFAGSMALASILPVAAFSGWILSGVGHPQQ